MRIIFIRHGQTTGDVEDRYGGTYNDELSQEGELQCRHMAEELSNKGIQAIYASSLQRAQQSAQILAEEVGCSITVMPELQERNQYGPLSGVTKAEAKISHPEWVEQLKDRMFTLPGAESYEDFSERVTKALSTILENNPPKCIAVVWHGGPMRVLYRHILQLGELKNIGDCCWVEVEFNGYSLHLLATASLLEQHRLQRENLQPPTP